MILVLKALLKYLRLEERNKKVDKQAHRNDAANPVNQRHKFLHVILSVAKNLCFEIPRFARD